MSPLDGTYMYLVYTVGAKKAADVSMIATFNTFITAFKAQSYSCTSIYQTFHYTYRQWNYYDSWHVMKLITHSQVITDHRFLSP